MSWALQRQLLFALGVVVIVGALGVGFFFSYVYESPSCFDGEQNQDEEGVDCGGVCTLLCSAPNIHVEWARSVPVASGVYHAVALVRNSDTKAAGTVPYTVTLFDEDNILITSREGLLPLDPGEVAPLFEANLVTGERTPSRTFVDIGEGVFERSEREVSQAQVIQWDFDEELLRLDAVIENQVPATLSDVRVTALLFNEEGVIVGASQTFSGPLLGGERKTVTFTWQETFSDSVARVDILPKVVKGK